MHAAVVLRVTSLDDSRRLITCDVAPPSRARRDGDGWPSRPPARRPPAHRVRAAPRWTHTLAPPVSLAQPVEQERGHRGPARARRPERRRHARPRRISSGSSCSRRDRIGDHHAVRGRGARWSATAAASASTSSKRCVDRQPARRDGRRPGTRRCRSRRSARPASRASRRCAAGRAPPWPPRTRPPPRWRASAVEVRRDVAGLVAPRCTPPMPPVANTRMPARAATASVAATVVEPGRPAATCAARLLRLSLAVSGAVASRSSSAAESPTRTRAVEHADGGGHGAGRRRPRPPAPRRAREPVGMRQPVGDQRGLERDHGAPCAERGGDERRDVEERRHAGRSFPHQPSTFATTSGRFATGSG